MQVEAQKKSLEVTPGTQEISYTSAADKVDYYNFSAVKNEEYQFGFLPEEGPNGEMIQGYYSIIVEDEYKAKLLKLRGNKGSGIRPQGFVIPESGKYFIKVMRHNGRERGPKPYRLVFKKTVVAAPPVPAEPVKEMEEKSLGGSTSEDPAQPPIELEKDLSDKGIKEKMKSDGIIPKKARDQEVKNKFREALEKQRGKLADPSFGE